MSGLVRPWQVIPSMSTGAALANTNSVPVACPYHITTAQQPASQPDALEQLRRQMRLRGPPGQDAIPGPRVPPALNKTPAAVGLSYQSEHQVRELQVGLKHAVVW